VTCEFESLTSADLASFATFGIDNALLTAAGIRRVTTEEAREHGIRYSGNLAGLFFPYFDPESGHRTTGRLRRDHPEVDGDGKPIAKYLAPYGDTRHLYFPPGSGSLLADPATTVLFVEAEKSALSGSGAASRTGRRLLVVATGGCWGWAGRIGKTEDPNGARVDVKGPLPDLARIVMMGRDVVIAFDSNCSTNANVQAARGAFARALVANGAKVRLADVPVEPGVNGPDDYLAVYGDAALFSLLDAAPMTSEAELEALSRQAGLHELTRDSSPDDIEGKVLKFSVLAGGKAKRSSAKRHAQHTLDRQGVSSGLSSQIVNTVFTAQRSQATQLVDLVLAAGVELFHDAAGDTYASVPIEEHRETMTVTGRSMRQWLARRSHVVSKLVPNGSAVADALNTLNGLARYEGAERETHLRVAGLDDALYLDLCNPHWQVVEITARGWQVVSEAPVRFRRTKGMLPLPQPERNGSLAGLRPFLNLSSGGDFALVGAYLLQALRPKGPYPVLNQLGEQGVGKTTNARVLRRLIDPNLADVRSDPREPRDLAVAADNGHVIVFDNLSHLPPWLSDALCRLSTGGGFSTRTLYTDREEEIFSAQRPVILTGIVPVATRGDLLDRSLVVTLPVIADAARRDERQFWAAFEHARPRILGALLDALVVGLQRCAEVSLPVLPRMADFAIWGVATEPACPWSEGTFLEAYAGNRQGAVEAMLEDDVVVQALRGLLDERTQWEGTSTELYEALTRHVPEARQKEKEWPRAPRGLTARLVRLSPDLRRTGLDVERFHDGTRRVVKVRCVNSVSSVGQPDNVDDSANATPNARAHAADGLLGPALSDDACNSGPSNAHTQLTQEGPLPMARDLGVGPSEEDWLDLRAE
jgi:hypothetical protein